MNKYFLLLSLLAILTSCLTVNLTNKSAQPTFPDDNQIQLYQDTYANISNSL